MSLLPRWYSRLPKPGRINNLGNFLEDLEHELSPLPSGLNVSSDDNNIYVEAHVPGLTAKDVDISIDSDNVLWIKGQKKEEEKDKKKKVYRSFQTSFSYCVPLWEEVDASVEPEAVVKEGIVKITFPKKKEKQAPAKKIKVKE